MSVAVSSPRPAAYSLGQITLHWIIAALVLFQLAFGDSMGRLASLLRRGETRGAGDVLMADLHIYLGIAVLLLVLVRIVLRIRLGAPATPARGHPLLGRLAAATHQLFYLLLVAMPVTGLVAEYLYRPMGEFHEAGKPLFIVLILLHVAGALFHQFALRDGVLTRMLRPAG
ncbi:cytochrome b [Methylobrevis pamukkalensis]|uniref:Cytochrome b562 n=1 Tax=Methylobrevis pamukkalensis TaxID=1439726 RepID=A0A1E3GYF9_9HYPH|nr:cytochrome b/b6 domain-containing protein [Methylobrevis pamukkalensis]ODN68965.1 Cytochrome b562 [Methylobrevis pamukkalensis]